MSPGVNFGLATSLAIATFSLKSAGKSSSVMGLASSFLSCLGIARLRAANSAASLNKRSKSSNVVSMWSHFYCMQLIIRAESYYFSDGGVNCANISAPVMFLVSLAKE